MKIQWAPPKAAHGQACNNCGQCCLDQPCPLATQVLRATEGPCPALEPMMFGYSCGLVAHPERYAPDVVARHGIDASKAAAAQLVGAGKGCDAFVDDERVDQSFRARIKAEALANPPIQSLKIWGLA